MNTELQMTLEAPSIYQPIMLSILEITSMTEMEKVFKIELPFPISLEHKPGQFVQVSVLGVGEAPISISSSPSRSKNSFELCVRRVGALTNALHALSPGDVVGVRGPFGRGFPLERFRGKDILFAPGGLGLAPLRSVINEVLDDRSNYGRIIILYGAREPAEILFQDEMHEWAAREDVELHLTVDQADGEWKGNVGVITTLFPNIQVSPRNTVAITCGPPVMYRFVLMELLGMGIPEGNIWLSLERRMKCGVGKCGHCQMDHIYVCQDGPAFSYAEIRHLEEAL
jgi:sulfite reductase subunit B